MVQESVQMRDTGALDAAERALRADGVVVLPTDTVYGIAALPDSAEAMEQLYALKGRPPSMPIAILVASRAQAEQLAAAVPDPAARVMDAFWPGPLTVVLAARHADGQRGQRTVGVRCPAHDFVRELARRTGPLAVTSANPHGEATPVQAEDAAAALDGDVSLVVDGGPCDGTASTVVDGTDPAVPVLREGPIRREEIASAALR
jgi:tRNA threonylcarbamoyl adenosine modification protein (Sua5/YciO/YrdC/YwlC family)